VVAVGHWFRSRGFVVHLNSFTFLSAILAVDLVGACARFGEWHSGQF
jgi:hypothetical protein